MIHEKDISFRAARPEDSDIIFELFEQVQNIHLAAEPKIFKPPLWDNHFQMFLDDLFNDDEQFLIFAEFEGRICGYVQFTIKLKSESIFQYQQKRVDIGQLVVANGFRKSGIGTYLINHVKRFARNSGAEILAIDYWSFNKASEHCFTKAGFETKYLVMQQDM
ncbi:MAG: GNAT family N-acetyltransferase [Lentilitoribacter sp.]|uniref:GNAT family N-acetyltransferase n=1 Tax=Hyphomonas sp. TaxID=87 RepID=UPI00328CDDCB